VRVLGIETSCDETAAAVADDGRLVLSNIVRSQVQTHAEYGGVVPEIASRAHAELVIPVIERALVEAGTTLGEIDAIAVTHRPGLIGALLVGLSAAKGLALALGVPLVGVHHIHAHLYAPLLADTDRPDPPLDGEVYPALGLALSGGHSAIYHLNDPLTPMLLGATIDDAIGEAYDKAAAILDLGYPGGPIIDQRAGRGDDRAHDLPVSRLAPDSLDFSFSGLKTALLYAVRGLPEPVPPGSPRGTRPIFPRDAHDHADGAIDDFCASFQRAAVDAVILKATRALDRLEAKGRPARSMLVGGGVAANSRLRSHLEDLSEKRSLPLHLSPMRYCLDNAAMIAGLAHRRLERGDADALSLEASPTGAADPSTA